MTAAPLCPPIKQICDSKLNLVKGRPLEIKASHFQCGPFDSNTDKTQIQTTASHNKHAQQLPDSTLMLHIVFYITYRCWVAGGFGTGCTSILVQYLSRSTILTPTHASSRRRQHTLWIHKPTNCFNNVGTACLCFIVLASDPLRLSVQHQNPLSKLVLKMQVGAAQTESMKRKDRPLCDVSVMSHVAQSVQEVGVVARRMLGWCVKSSNIHCWMNCWGWGKFDYKKYAS